MADHVDEDDGPFAFTGLKEDLARLREVCLRMDDRGRLAALTDDEIARRVRDQGVPMTRGSVQQLCDGTAPNPSATKLLGLAQAFGVSPAYFFSDAVRRRTNRRLDARLEALRTRALFGDVQECDQDGDG